MIPLKPFDLMRSRSLSRSCGVAALFAAACMFGSSAQAAAVTYTWNNAGGGSLWSAANYVGGTAAPSLAGDTALFNTAVSGVITVPANGICGNMIFDTSASSMTIGTLGQTQAITIAHYGSISLVSTLTGSNKTITINAPIKLSDTNYAFQNYGGVTRNNNLIFNGDVSGGVAGTVELTLGGDSGALNAVNGNIVNGVATMKLKKSAASTWTLAGAANSYSGATTVTGGTLNLTGGLTGATAITVSAASAVFAQTATGSITHSGASLTVTAGTAALAGSVNNYNGATAVSGGLLSLTGGLTGATAITVSGAGRLDQSSSGFINNAGASLTIAGGTATLSGANTYAGATTVNSGKLILGVSGSISGSTINNNSTIDVSAKNASPFTVASAQTLNNNGSVVGNLSVAGLVKGTGSVTGDVTVVNGGELAPGNSPGTQTISGDFTMDSGAKLSIELGKTSVGEPVAGTDYDQVIVAGDVSLAGNLALTLNTGGVGIENGDVFYIIINSGAGTTSGLFDTINNAAFSASDFVVDSQHFKITTTADFGGTGFGSASGNDIALMVVPEPATWAMLLGGFGMLLGCQNLRRRNCK